MREQPDVEAEEEVDNRTHRILTKRVDSGWNQIRGRPGPDAASAAKVVVFLGEVTDGLTAYPTVMVSGGAPPGYRVTDDPFAGPL